MRLIAGRFLPAFVAVLMLSAWASAQTVEDANDLLKLERERYDAMVAVDVDRLSSMLGDELIFTHASGKIDSKNTFMESLVSGSLDYRRIELDDERAHLYDSVGIVTGRLLIDISVRGECRMLQLRITSVWVRAAGGWKIVAYQSTKAG